MRHLKWVMLEKNLLDKPEVSRIADAVGLDRYSVIGRLARVWGWAEDLIDSEEWGFITAEVVDSKAGDKDGFHQAMEKVGWGLVGMSEEKLVKWRQLNGQAAKKRMGGNSSKKAARNMSDDARAERERQRQGAPKKEEIMAEGEKQGFPVEACEAFFSYHASLKWAKIGPGKNYPTWQFALAGYVANGAKRARAEKRAPAKNGGIGGGYPPSKLRRLDLDGDWQDMARKTDPDCRTEAQRNFLENGEMPPPDLVRLDLENEARKIEARRAVASGNYTEAQRDLANTGLHQKIRLKLL